MLKQVNKTIEHRGYKFNISVTFCTKVERRLNGLSFHTIEINNTDNSYVRKIQVEDKLLEQSVIEVENEARMSINEKLDGVRLKDVRLLNLGFS